MEFSEIVKKTKEIQGEYDTLNRELNQREWGTREYVEALVGDVGDLTKLVMMQNSLRPNKHNDLKQKIRHEICDCLWSIILIADKEGVVLEDEYMKQMDQLKQRITSEKY